MLAWSAGMGVEINKDHVNGVVVVFAADGAGRIRPMDVMEQLGLKGLKAMCVLLPKVNTSLSKIHIELQISRKIVSRR